MRKLFFILLFLFSGWEMLFAQFVTNGNGNHLVSMKFLKPKIEAKANESFFNILTLKNNSNKTFSGKIKFTQPADWNIIGDNEINLNIPSGDSLNFPIRIIVSNKVLGEVAYAVVAGLFGENNRPILSEYCFINIPRISDLKIKSPNRIIYFDNKTGTAKFQYIISNQGNTNEIIQLNFEHNDFLSVDGKTLNESYAYEYSIPAHTDTTFEINVNIKENDLNKDFFKLDINTFTLDSLYKSKLWFNKLNNNYNYTIPEINKCAIIELLASDIFSTRSPRYSLMLQGSLLFKNNMDVFYYFRKNDLYSDWDNYYNTRGYIGIKTKKFKFKLGNVENFFNERMYGIGGIGEFYLKKITLGSFYSYNEKILQSFYGANIDFSFQKKINIELGYSENVIESYKNYTKILLSGISFALYKKHRFNIKTYLNNTTYANSANPFDKQGIAILGKYSSSINRLRTNISVEYGSPNYSGISRGRFFANSNLNYILNNKNNVGFLYSKSDLTHLYYIDDVQQPIQKTLYDNYSLTYNRIINKYLIFNFRPSIKTERFNSPYLLTDPNQFFKTITPGVLMGLRLSNTESKVYIKPQIEFGKVITISEQNLNNIYSLPYNTFNVSLYSTYKELSLYAQYRNGPTGIFAQYLYYNSGYYTKWLYLMPAYNKDFYNKRLNLDLRANYRYDINSEDRYLSFTTMLSLYLPNSWTLRFLNSISNRSQRDAINNSTVGYSSAYFEAGIRKEFNCKQPRFQYYDLNIIFFKDLNGNRKKEKNEPGLRNVLALIESNYEIEDKFKKDFISHKLLTGADGNISYTNIVNGAYNLNYVLIGDMVGNFNREELTQQFVVDEDKTIYIPYLENNRIIGKVILNRDPLSSFGNIPIENIRVIAEDTKGHSYSALTDKQGNFTLYTPVADHYIVKINNIFYESFDIQQPEFIVKFNGYKQFEVTFVFDEKKKKINFDNELADEDLKLDDIKVIRKTTLTGKIRDAISLEPVEAEIKIIDNRTNKVISRSVSNRLNGNYNISYAAGTHFRVEVVAKGYWEHVENLYIEQVISIQNINKDLMLNKEGENIEEQKTFIIYDKEEEFTQNFKRGQQIPINYLTFDLKQTRLDPKAQPELDRLIELLNKNKSVKIEIAGHADDKGNARVENMMAKRRAEAVKKYLVSHGLSENRISVQSYSNKRPLIPGTSEKARSKNRRVEIIVQ